jgi:hypothetical protein
MLTRPSAYIGYAKPASLHGCRQQLFRIPWVHPSVQEYPYGNLRGHEFDRQQVACCLAGDAIIVIIANPRYVQLVIIL